MSLRGKYSILQYLASQTFIMLIIFPCKIAVLLGSHFYAPHHGQVKTYSVRNGIKSLKFLMSYYDGKKKDHADTANDNAIFVHFPWK